MKLVLKVAGSLLAAVFLALYGYCVGYNVFRLQFSLYDSFVFAFVQVPLMILTLFGAMIAYWVWTAIIISLGAAVVWFAIRLRRPPSE
ncbi:MAG TPA: hypothetical protein VGS27_24195 [Candidatus Sulfotelmatobacter sp.]|nr:hypothetical protein [Candidatus Sulfotelmatobacter sp.]